MPGRLGGPVARRPLRFIWMLDVSGSMELDGKIQALNTAIEETVPLLVEDARANPEADLTIQALTFATAPSWLDQHPVPAEDYSWAPVAAVHQGLTELGLAIRELLPVMDELQEMDRGFAPAIVLVSDGQPSHVVGPRMEDALQELVGTPWGSASVRAAVGIGRDADMESLTAFMGNNDLQPVHANSPEELVSMIQWVSRVVSNIASTPAGVVPHEVSPLGASSSGRIWDDPVG